VHVSQFQIRHDRLCAFFPKNIINRPKVAVDLPWGFIIYFFKEVVVRVVDVPLDVCRTDDVDLGLDTERFTNAFNRFLVDLFMVHYIYILNEKNIYIYPG